MAAKKPTITEVNITEVDIAAVIAEQTGGGSDNDIVDVSSIPSPASLDELPIYVGIVEGGVDIDLNDTLGMNTMLGKSAAAMAASDADQSNLVPDDGEFIKVFYHSQTRKYVQFNQALVGRSDFKLQRVKKADFTKLNVSA